ncbi:MAG: hypothetical protein AB2799_13130 [Candidatus Thiodiazotropha sp.]
MASRQARQTGGTESPKTINGAARRNEDTGDGLSHQGRLLSEAARARVATVISQTGGRTRPTYNQLQSITPLNRDNVVWISQSMDCVSLKRYE